MRIMYFADLHLEKMKSVLGEHALNIQMRAFKRQIELARSKRCTHAVVLGDVFDSAYPSQHTMRAFIRVLADADDLEWLVYSGNHDRDDINTCSLDLMCELPEIGALKHVTFKTKPELIKWGDAKVYVMPWSRPKPVPDECDFVFFHDAVSGAKKDNGTPYTGGLSRSIFRGKPTVGGDLHMGQRIKNVLYPGTAAQLSFGEHLPKHVWYGEFDKRNGLVNKCVKSWEPEWRLEEVRYDEENPPACDDPKVRYKLRVPNGVRVPPRWLIDHPLVVRTDGVRSKEKKEDHESMLVEVAGVQDKSQRMRRWLRKNTPLDKAQRLQALKLHDSFGESQDG